MKNILSLFLLSTLPIFAQNATTENSYTYHTQLAGAPITIGQNVDTPLWSTSIGGNTLGPAGGCISIQLMVLFNAVTSDTIVLKLKYGSASISLLTIENGAAFTNWFAFNPILICNNIGMTNGQQVTVLGGPQSSTDIPPVFTMAVDSTIRQALSLTATSTGSGDSATPQFWRIQFN